MTVLLKSLAEPLTALWGGMIYHLAESTAFVGLALVASWVLHPASARARHAVWLAAFLKFAVPTALVAALVLPPTWRLRLSPADMAESSLAGAGGVAPWLPSAITLGTAIWIVIALAILLRHRRECRRTGALIARETSAAPPSLLARVDAVRGRLGMRRRVRIVVSHGSLGPCVFGLRFPTIALPDAVVTRLSGEEIDSLLTHELAHIARWDLLASALLMLLSGVFWFWPPLRYVGRRLAETREEACDEVAISGDGVAVYLGALRACGAFQLAGPTAGLQRLHASSLARRVELMSTPGRVGGNCRWRGLASAAMLACGVALSAVVTPGADPGVAALHRVSAPESGPFPVPRAAHAIAVRNETAPPPPSAGSARFAFRFRYEFDFDVKVRTEPPKVKVRTRFDYGSRSGGSP